MLIVLLCYSLTLCAHVDEYQWFHAISMACSYFPFLSLFLALILPLGFSLTSRLNKLDFKVGNSKEFKNSMCPPQVYSFKANSDDT